VELLGISEVLIVGPTIVDLTRSFSPRPTKARRTSESKLVLVYKAQAAGRTAVEET